MLVLKFIQFFLLVGHLVGAGMLSTIILFDKNVPNLKLNQMSMSFVTLSLLLASDILILLIFFNVSTNSERAVEFLDAMSVFTFIGIFVNISNSKVASLFKGISSSFYRSIRLYIYVKILVSVCSFFIGFSFAQGQLSLNTCIYYSVISFGNGITLVLSRREILRLRLDAAMTRFTRSNDELGVGSVGESRPTATYARIKRRQNARIANSNLDPLEQAFIEINAIIFGGVIIHLIAITATIILLCIYRDTTSFSTSLIISIPWKIAIGLGISIIPYAHMKANGRIGVGNRAGTSELSDDFPRPVLARYSSFFSTTLHKGLSHPWLIASNKRLLGGGSVADGSVHPAPHRSSIKLYSV